MRCSLSGSNICLYLVHKRKEEKVRKKQKQKERDPALLHTIRVDNVLHFSRLGRPSPLSVPVINLTFLAGVNLFQVFGL